MVLVADAIFQTIFQAIAINDEFTVCMFLVCPTKGMSTIFTCLGLPKLSHKSICEIKPKVQFPVLPFGQRSQKGP